jgi:hypothetical protein
VINGDNIVKKNVVTPKEKLCSPIWCDEIEPNHEDRTLLLQLDNGKYNILKLNGTLQFDEWKYLPVIGDICCHILENGTKYLVTTDGELLLNTPVKALYMFVTYRIYPNLPLMYKAVLPNNNTIILNSDCSRFNDEEYYSVDEIYPSGIKVRHLNKTPNFVKFDGTYLLDDNLASKIYDIGYLSDNYYLVKAKPRLYNLLDNNGNPIFNTWFDEYVEMENSWDDKRLFKVHKKIGFFKGDVTNNSWGTQTPDAIFDLETGQIIKNLKEQIHLSLNDIKQMVIETIKEIYKKRNL